MQKKPNTGDRMTDKTPADLQEAIARYKYVETLMPGFKWGDDTALILEAASRQAAAPSGEDKCECLSVDARGVKHRDIRKSASCPVCGPRFRKLCTPSPAEITKEQPQNNHNLSCPADDALREAIRLVETGFVLEDRIPNSEINKYVAAIEMVVTAARSHLERQAAGEGVDFPDYAEWKALKDRHQEYKLWIKNLIAPDALSEHVVAKMLYELNQGRMYEFFNEMNVRNLIQTAAYAHKLAREQALRTQGAAVDVGALLEKLSTRAANIDDGSGPPRQHIEWVLINLQAEGRL